MLSTHYQLRATLLVVVPAELVPRTNIATNGPLTARPPRGTNAAHGMLERRLFINLSIKKRFDSGLLLGADSLRNKPNGTHYSGMFPCFLGGNDARLPRSERKALMTATRVAAGSITPSSSPRSAAKNGLATL